MGIFCGLALEVHHFFSYSIGQNSVIQTQRTARQSGKCSQLCAQEEKEVRFGEHINASHKHILVEFNRKNILNWYFHSKWYQIELYRLCPVEKLLDEGK